MRRLRLRALTLTAVAVLCLPLAACGSSGGSGGSEGSGGSGTAGGNADSGTITLMAYTASFQDNYTKAVIEPFQKKYPNIKVTYEPSQNSATMLGQLRTQKSNPQVDVAIMDTSVSATGNTEGLFAPLDPSIVTNLADIAARGRTPKGFGPAVTFDNLVLIYNTDAIKTAPDSWNALWDPAYKGKVAIPAAPDIQGLSLTMIVDKMQGADYEKTIDPAIKKLAELAPSVSTWNPQPDVYTPIIQGQDVIGIGWNARGQHFHDTSNGKLGVVLPSEGSVFQINTINLVKGSKNAKAAQTFINYALSPEAQAAFAEAMFYAPTNTKTKVPAAADARTASSPERQKQMLKVDWTWVAGQRDKWTDLWRRQVIGG